VLLFVTVLVLLLVIDLMGRRDDYEHEHEPEEREIQPFTRSTARAPAK
jgi:hypothetical protein